MTAVHDWKNLAYLRKPRVPFADLCAETVTRTLRVTPVTEGFIVRTYFTFTVEARLADRGFVDIFIICIVVLKNIRSFLLRRHVLHAPDI